MSLEPLTNADAAIQLHAFAAIAALLLGALVLFRRKGTSMHRVGGRVWAALMLIVALSSFFIHSDGSAAPSSFSFIAPDSPLALFSWIHLLSVLTLVLLILAINHARRGRIIAHRVTMTTLYFGALVVAGAFTFMPGRIMHEVVVEPLLVAFAG